jgi:Ca2+-transporting ATPase
MQTVWHTLTPDAAFARLGSRPDGLTADEAARALAEHGPNELQAATHVSPWTLLLAQLKNVLIIILLVATALSALLGHGTEAIAIAVIVLFAVLLGFVQEYRAERALEALREMAAPMANVLRGGEELHIPARDLVPGDVVLLRAGDKVPADARVVEAMNLQCEEAALTGESVPVEKTSDALPTATLEVGDRKNIVHAGTVTTYGRGRALVVATGMTTEFGKIAKMLEGVETGRTPLQENLDRVGHTLARAALVIVAIIVALGLWRGQPFIEMLIFGIALAVAVVPEALPAVVTISLAIGVRRMVKRNALVRRLPAVETLGSMSVICSDKTGTLTKDEMTVRRIYVAARTIDVSGAGYAPRGDLVATDGGAVPQDALRAFLEAALLSSDAVLCEDEKTGSAHIKGDPTEGALVVAAAKTGLRKPDVDCRCPRVDEIPFSSESKRMTTLHSVGDSVIAYAKGAPEIMLAACDSELTEAGVQALDESCRAAILAEARGMAEDALRVLAVARKSDVTRDSAERGMVFLGLAGMIDPPRPEARASIETCRDAGIKVVMITGDHPITAKAIARDLGLLTHGELVTGAEIDAMSDDELDRVVEKIEVCARVSPAHKLRVVSALQHRGYVAAMTGDGVNDAPALKKADVGIAMGIAGTDVSREAAAITLLDDNFASIVAAVEEGRGIFANIKKYLTYLISSNIGEIGLLAGATALGLPLPLTAVQILYVNLATDGLPALALSVDPFETDMMRRPPRNPRSGIFMPSIVALMLVGGVWSTLTNLAVFTWALHSGRPVAEAVTMTFVSLVLIQFIKAYNFRSDHQSVLVAPFANKWLNLAVLWELVLLVVIVYAPFLREPFSTFSLSLVDWCIVTAAALTIAPALELTKWWQRHHATEARPPLERLPL